MMTQPRNIGMDKIILRRQPEQREPITDMPLPVRRQPRSRQGESVTVLAGLVEEANASGRVAQLIERHGVVGLSVAPLIAAGVA